jgi:hypothetical protein
VDDHRVTYRTRAFNVCESPEFAGAYLAEFLRLYERFRARAVWSEIHGGGKKSNRASAPADAFVLKTRRDAWVRNAYVRGTSEYRVRTDLLGAP